MTRYKFYILGIIIIAIVFINFYAFSRLTIDDAFISWRYGFNFINKNIWGYNPTNFDLTQAYTNPLFAFLSIIPAYLGMDVVLFFKCISIAAVAILTGVFISLCDRKSSALLLLGVIFCIPASVIHLFSGLETFAFGFILGLFFIFFEKDRALEALISLALLCFIRPEAWILVALLFFIIAYLWFSNENILYRSYTIGIFVLTAALLLYFTSHYFHFGDLLPNTFYVKNANSFHEGTFIKFSIFLIPLVVVSSGYRKSTNFIIFTFMFVLILKYSTSNLAMNYASRFLYHLIIPIMLLIIYDFSKDTRQLNKRSILNFINQKFSPINGNLIIGLTFSGLIAMTFVVSSRPETLLRMANYYPRLLESHAALGEALRSASSTLNFETYSFGDAGVVAFNSGINNLDTVGLASQMVAKSGMVTDEVIEAYSPSVVIFYGDEFQKIASWPSQHSQLENYINLNNFEEICSIYFRPGDLLTVYSDLNLGSFFESVCSNHRKVNNLSELDFLTTHITTPPWEYWTTIK